MNKHFSYLTDEQSHDFFQKLACEAAEEHLGATPATLSPPAMEKEASAQTGFEKVASRLDRDLGILKTAGACGTEFGMCKRANAYLDVLIANTELSAEEFGEVFDKVASEAITVDLDASWEELGAECPEELHPWLYDEFSKIGHSLTKEALMQKEAIMGLLRAGGRFLSRARAGGAAAKAVTGAKLRQVAGMPGRTLTRLKGTYGGLRASGAARKMRSLKKEIAGIKGRGVGQTAARKNLAKQYASQVQKREKGLKAFQEAGAKLPEGGGRLSAIPQSGRVSGRKPPTTLSEMSDKAFMAKRQTAGAAKSKQIQGEAGQQRAANEAAGAARQGQDNKPFSVIQGGKGTGTDGPAPAPVTKPGVKSDPEKGGGITPGGASPETGELTLSAISKKWKSGEPLTLAEKRHVQMQAAKGLVGWRVLMGKGALTGGEGVV